MVEESELHALIDSLRAHGQDFTEVEVKRASGGYPELGETLSAFGNMPQGGTIILGLDEEQGFSATGISDPATFIERLSAQARTGITPPLQVGFDEVAIEGVTLLVAHVAPLPLHQRPARYRGVAYLRQGDGDYRMSNEEVQQMYALRDRPRNDAVPVVGSSVTDLDTDLTEMFLDRVRSSSRRLADQDDTTVLKRKGVLASDGVTLTVAGLYALGNYPQQFLPGLSITAAVQHRVGDERGLEDLVHLDGPIPHLLDTAMAWVQRNTRADVRFERGGEAFDATEIPLIAVRELIANALVHRDLSPHAQSKRVELRLKDDTLVIYSPGGLYGVSVGQLGQPEGKSAVNEFLYEVCKFVRMHNGSRVIEGEGGGLPEVMRALHRANMRPPRFVDRGINFTVLLPRHALIEPSELEWITAHDPDRELSDVQRQVLASMREGTIWTNASVRRRFAPIDSREARAALQGLVNLGFASAHGERAQTVYVLNEVHAKHPANTDPSHTRITRAPSQAASATAVSAPARPQSVPDPVAVQGSPSKATFSRNTDLIYDALVEDGPHSIQEIMARTSLTAGQVRYALKQLIDLELIEVLGGWGVRGTGYRAASNSR